MLLRVGSTWTERPGRSALDVSLDGSPILHLRSLDVTLDVP